MHVQSALPSAPHLTPISMMRREYVSPVPEWKERLVGTMHGMLEQQEEMQAFYDQMRYHCGFAVADHTTPSREQYGGKLFRPLLLMGICNFQMANHLIRRETRSSRMQLATIAGAALELTHAFSLLHDDIEDGDTTRRGRPTVWSVWGLAHGVNTGDGMLAVAHLLLDMAAGSDRTVLLLHHLLNTAQMAMIEGQYLDLTLTVDCSLSDYEVMIARKTGALITAAAEMGSRIGSPCSQKSHPVLRQIGHHLGSAFQMRNDRAGTWSGEDIQKRTVTLPVVLAMASPLRDTFRALFSEKGTAREDILVFYDQEGINEKCEALVQTHLDTAQALLDEHSTYFTMQGTHALDVLHDIIMLAFGTL